jgi:hypothetical protein
MAEMLDTEDLVPWLIAFGYDEIQAYKIAATFRRKVDERNGDEAETLYRRLTFARCCKKQSTSKLLRAFRTSLSARAAAAPLFSGLRQLYPLACNPQPRFLVEGADCSLCLLPTFFGLGAHAGGTPGK